MRRLLAVLRRRHCMAPASHSRFLRTTMHTSATLGLRCKSGAIKPTSPLSPEDSARSSLRSSEKRYDQDDSDRLAKRWAPSRNADVVLETDLDVDRLARVRQACKLSGSSQQRLCG